MRLMGKRQIGNLQPFDLIVSIMIADLASMPLSDVNMPLLSGLVPISVLLLLQLLVALVSFKSKKARRIICGEPTAIIEEGRIRQDYMQKMLLSIDDLLEMVRIDAQCELTNIRFAIVETNGSVSITKRADKGMMISVIEQGRLLEANLESLGLNPARLDGELQKNGIAAAADVFFGYYLNGKFYFIEKESK